MKTVKTRLFRALAKLRGTLDVEFKERANSARDWRLLVAPVVGPGLAGAETPEPVSMVDAAPIVPTAQLGVPGEREVLGKGGRIAPPGPASEAEATEQAAIIVHMPGAHGEPIADPSQAST